MEGLSRKLASDDKILENINNGMDSFSLVIKNQHSFNKMIESQITQLVAAVPRTDKGKILGQLEDLEQQILSTFTMQHITVYNHRRKGG